MGSGCSSPLKRFSGKRNNNHGNAHRNSDPYGVNAPDEPEQVGDKLKPTIQMFEFKCEQPVSPNQPQQQLQQNLSTTKVGNSDQNEVTNLTDLVFEDQPSSCSYITDCINNNDLINKNEDSTNITSNNSFYRANNVTSTTCDKSGLPINAENNHQTHGSLFGKMKGLNGTCLPHDRHLLVSPALSPAPSSICYSPLPATSALGQLASLDLNQLVEAFGILTLGTHALDRCQSGSKNQSSELKQNFTQHLVQTTNDLINTISVIYITVDNYNQNQYDNVTSQDSSIESSTLPNQIEANLKEYCDERLFSLRFFNLSLKHLKQHFHINNLLDVTLQILKQEFQINSQRVIVIILANLNSTPIENDEKQLPVKISCQTMNKILDSTPVRSDSNMKNLFKNWYDQSGTYYHLKPIYLNRPSILSDSISNRNEAWQSWLTDSTKIARIINEVLNSDDDDLKANIRLQSHFDAMIDFILEESSLQKRSLLIRNNFQPIESSSTIQPSNSQNSKLNQLIRLLPDPNKLSIKRTMNHQEFLTTISNWVQDNFSKFFDSIIENHMNHGKYIPPFIDKNLFRELTSQRTKLENHLQDITETFSAKCRAIYSTQIQPLLNSMFMDNNNQSLSAISEKNFDDETQTNSNHLVFVSGPKGCGKSSLISQVIRLAAKDFNDRAHIIYRFCGISLDSLNCDRILRSICEQFCQIQGENITAASHVYSNRKEMMAALNKITKEQPTIILLDDLDLCKPKIETNLKWLFEFSTSSNVKIIVTLRTDSVLYHEVLTNHNDASFLSLDNPALTDWGQVLISKIKSLQLSSPSVIEEIRRACEEIKPTIPLNYFDMIEILNISRLRKLNNEISYPELDLRGDLEKKLELIYKAIFSHLEYLITPYQLCSLIVIMYSSRNGMLESDIINIMTNISQSSKVYNNSDYKFSLALWDYLKTQLKPWLSMIICDKSVKIRLEHGFLNQAIQYYSTREYPRMVGEIREVLFDYFNRSVGPKKSRSNILKSSEVEKIEARMNSRNFDYIALATKYSEMANLLILMNKSKARDYYVNKHQFFHQFLYSSMPEEFIEDCERLKDNDGRKSSINDDLQSLVTYVKQCVYPLRYDGFQIYSQIYCRAYDAIKLSKSVKSKKLNDILSAAACPPVRSLLPLSETSVNSFIKTKIGSTIPTNISNEVTNASQAQSSNRCPSKQLIFNIRDDHRHVVVLYPDKSLLLVWDIYEERAVRTISNVEHPRDLRMIDGRRAVILCNRELRVYDLDTGNMLTKLKGVMNQKMPYFEVFGDNYVIALARNRMYVNMMNLSTGELETTFKVGEDRFLNSLLVSADGGVCVCGDETQKPFPLLVWNLNERRLMYDLRLDRHEFLTKISAISDDGHFVVSVCKQISEGDNISFSSNENTPTRATPNFIVIYDLSSGTLFKKWKPGLDTCAVAISYSSNRSGKVINAIADCTILVWDLVTGSKKHTLTGHTAPPDVIQVQNCRLFSMDSSCCDQSLRIWDLEEGYCLSVFSPDAPLSRCQLSIRGDALICGFASDTRLSTLVMCKNESVSDVAKRNKRRKSSKSVYVFDEPPSRKCSS